MAERLTESEVSKSFTEQELRTSEQARIYQKLGELEDILEKYNIESVGELEDKIICYEENKDVNLGLKFDIKKLEKDRDTWKRACELACEREDDCYVYDNIHRAYEFYQQAKQVTGKLPAN